VYHPIRKNFSYVLTHFLATLTQFLARLRGETGIRRRNFGTVGVQLFPAGLWVNLEFRQRYASEKRRTNILIKLNELAILYVKSGEFMVFPTTIQPAHLMTPTVRCLLVH
jgi:hypothetical protein